MNEKKTENIVRKHFEKYSDIFIDEQITENLKINKLLQNAAKSKKGENRGRPEFIITYKNNPDFLIVIECKADIKKHESKSGDRYSEFAVDGVKLYASFLAKEFDVLAIAVSGEKPSEIKISHFLFLKGNTTSASIFSNKLLDSESYLIGYINNEEKINQDFNPDRPITVV